VPQEDEGLVSRHGKGHRSYSHVFQSIIDNRYGYRRQAVIDNVCTETR